MKLILGIVVSLASFFMLYLFLAIFSASSFEVARQQIFQQSKQEVWHKFSRFKNWESWSPWNNQDQTISYSYSGKQGRKGAKVNWTGNKIGKGSMTVSEIIPFQELTYTIQLSDWDSKTVGNIKLTETSTGTLVVWKTSGELSFWTKPMASLGFYDKIIGRDFESAFEEISRQLKQY